MQICVCAKICEIGLFRKMPLSRHFAHFFGHPSLRPFFDLVLFWLVAEMSTRWTRAKRYETRGFGPISRLSSSLTPVVALQNLDSSTIIFFGVLLFSIFRSSIF